MFTSSKIPGVSLTNRVADDLDELQLNYILEDTLHMNIDYRDKRSFAVYVDSTGISVADNFRIVSPVIYDVHLLEIEGPRALLHANPSDSFLIAVHENQINGNYNDEIQFEVDPKHAEDLCSSLVLSALETGEYYNIRIKIEAEATQGNNWSETH